MDTPEAVSTRPLPGLRHSLRVPMEKLEGLTNLAPELVLQSLKASERHIELRRLETRLSRLRDRVREARVASGASTSGHAADLREYADSLDAICRRMREFLVDFSDDRVRLNLITEELRQNVIELTMLPLSTVFDAFPRSVRDLARTFDKEVDLTIRGRETELDKKIIEQIAEPLVHMIRNALDHGLEAPAERIESGKPATGQLLISAEQQGNRILVAVRDDGRGIDPGALREAAVRCGMASAAEMESWTPQQLLEIIFQPGFSTRSSTTDISGRGVGMDIVKSVVVRLGGTVRIQSEPGRGTTVVLDLPLSLALLRVVLVEAGDEIFALPTAAVRRILRIAPTSSSAASTRHRRRDRGREHSADGAERIAAAPAGRDRGIAPDGPGGRGGRRPLRPDRGRRARGTGARVQGAARPAPEPANVCGRGAPRQR